MYKSHFSSLVRAEPETKPNHMGGSISNKNEGLNT